MAFTRFFGEFVQISGAGEIRLQLNERTKRIANSVNGEYSVEYSAPYAVYVHENTAAYHRNGEAKFLEKPAREHRKELAEIVRKHARYGNPRLGMYNAARRLLALSRKIVPVDTGFLKSSGKVVKHR